MPLEAGTSYHGPIGKTSRWAMCHSIISCRKACRVDQVEEKYHVGRVCIILREEKMGGK